MLLRSDLEEGDVLTVGVEDRRLTFEVTGKSETPVVEVPESQPAGTKSE